MKKTAFPFLAFLLVLTACQKEPDFTDPGNSSSGSGDGGTTSGLLTRLVEVDGSDSAVYTFFYNAAGKLIQYNYADTGYASVNKFVRNANGIITQTVFISPDLSALGLDSVVTNVFYNAASSRYTHTRTDVTVSGVTFSDSTAYGYDASGNLSGVVSYQKTTGLPYVPSSRTDYAYTGGNLVTEKLYSYNSSTSAWDLGANLAYTYDAKTNPLKLGAEAFIVGFSVFFGPNNNSGVTYTDATDPSSNYSQTYAYTYNSANKPLVGTITENPGGATYSLRYYYN